MKVKPIAALSLLGGALFANAATGFFDSFHFVTGLSGDANFTH